MAKLTARRVADAIRLYKGNVSAVAQSFERSRTAVYNFVRRHRDLAEADVSSCGSVAALLLKPNLRPFDCPLSAVATSVVT